ncbi:MAG TPA: hypothetical protein VHT29_00630 [Solirubrobacteraceae bacterium]|jgi:hypothetical protein|nr:hypothetical protein [Solirubrobacteraceae bacterium]
MARAAPEGSGDQNWRLEAELPPGGDRSLLHELVEHLRGQRDLVEEIESAAPHEVVITHDGKRIFAYALTRAALDGARRLIEARLSLDGIAPVSVRVSHWEDEHDRWQQLEPPPVGDEKQREDEVDRRDDEVQTRTLVATSGRMIRSEFEQTMSTWARELGLQCKLVEHPHLLSTQVAFTVTGHRRKLDEFAAGLRAEGWATFRTETAVMMSPL